MLCEICSWARFKHSYDPWSACKNILTCLTLPKGVRLLVTCGDKCTHRVLPLKFLFLSGLLCPWLFKLLFAWLRRVVITFHLWCLLEMMQSLTPEHLLLSYLKQVHQMVTAPHICIRQKKRLWTLVLSKESLKMESDSWCPPGGARVESAWGPPPTATPLNISNTADLPEPHLFQYLLETLLQMHGA